MIYVTGDIHGEIDIRKLSAHHWAEGKNLTRGDYLIICGDFGLVWDWSEADKYWLNWLSEKPWTTLWVDGNHENHDLIDTFPTEELFGGTVQRVPEFPDVIHLMRGEVYNIPDSPESTVRCFVMGGAASSDKKYRTEGKTWWAREMPSQEGYDRATANLEKVGWSVDYVFSHDCPAEYVDCALETSLSSERLAGGEEGFDELENFLQMVDNKLDKERLKRWYFGHYHDDRTCRDKQHILLYYQIVLLGEVPEEMLYR